MTTVPDTVLADGRYRLVERLAVGGMGEVWRARDESLGRQVAIKVLKDEYASDETFRTRFRAEARNTAGLSHPGIATMYDYNEEDGLAYLVMELVPGRPLSAFLADGGRLDPDVTLDIVGQAARALHAAHAAGLIHRDIKPGNLIIQPDGRVKVTDFGIARVVNEATLTQTGTVLGTAQYVSPEQAQGRKLTPSTDIYSLGVVAYQCLAGQLPFTGDSAVSVALAQVRDEPPPLPEDVPTAARELVGRCLDKDPHGRPASSGELADLASRARESPWEAATVPASGAAAPTRPDGSSRAGAAALARDETRAVTAAAPGGGARLDDATLAAGAPGAAGTGGAGDAAPHSRRNRRALLAAGLASVAVLCAVLLTLGWGALFGPGGEPAGRGNPGGVEAPPSPDSGSGDDGAGGGGSDGGQPDRQAGDADREGSGGGSPSPDDQRQGQQGGDATDGSGDPSGNGRKTTSPPDDGTSSSPSPSGTGSGSPSPSGTPSGDDQEGENTSAGGAGSIPGAPGGDTGDRRDESIRPVGTRS